LLAKHADEGLAVGEPAIITRARHRAELEAAAEALKRFREERGGPEIKAEELRIAARHLGRLTGRIDVEEVLGAIFSEFCIGK
jgi:tRNA modification GTPase